MFLLRRLTSLGFIKKRYHIFFGIVAVLTMVFPPWIELSWKDFGPSESSFGQPYFAGFHPWLPWQKVVDATPPNQKWMEIVNSPEWKYRYPPAYFERHPFWRPLPRTKIIDTTPYGNERIEVSMNVGMLAGELLMIAMIWLFIFLLERNRDRRFLFSLIFAEGIGLLMCYIFFCYPFSFERPFQG